MQQRQWSPTKLPSTNNLAFVSAHFHSFTDSSVKNLRKGGIFMTNEKQEELVFTPYITLKNGHRIYARQYGKKVFCFPKKREKTDGSN